MPTMQYGAGWESEQAASLCLEEKLEIVGSLVVVHIHIVEEILKPSLADDLVHCTGCVRAVFVRANSQPSIPAFILLFLQPQQTTAACTNC